MLYCFSSGRKSTNNELQLYGGLYAWNIYFQGVKGKSPIGTGVALLPIMLSTVPSTMITSRLIARIGKFQYFAIAGWVMVVLGNGLVIMWDLNTSTAAWVIIQIVCGASQVRHAIAVYPGLC